MVDMMTTNQQLFCELLDRSILELSDIDVTFRDRGIEAAEKQLADYIRSTLKTENFFKIPYQPRENAWALPEDDDFAAAEKIINGELRSIAFPHKFTDTSHVDWEFNPTPNESPEWTWQLSRHHEWRCLGHCYRLSGDEKYAKAFTELFMSWCEQAKCPSDMSKNTKCWRTIEAGIRLALNWNYAFYSFYKSPYMTDRVICTYVRSICDHGYRLSRFHSVAGNWLIMEMAGLAHIGMLYPFLTNAREWGDYAFSRLQSELDRQVYRDGFQFELSTNYHDVVIMNYHRVFAAAREIGYPVSREFIDKLLPLFELDINITCPDGKYPDLNDGHRASLETWCRLGSIYFPKHEAINYFATNGKDGRAPEYTSVALPYSGLAFMRTGWGKDDLWCFMDAGDFGRGHQHEDKLNILMYAYGKNLLPDSGCYSYDSSAMRRFVLDSRSHNCAMVDDMSQNRRGRYHPDNEPLDRYAGMLWSFSADVDSVEGVYDQGYGEQYLHVIHKRKLILFKKGVADSAPFAMVIDRFTSEDGEEHLFQPSYQLGTEPYTDDGVRFTSDHGDQVSFSIVASERHSIIIGQEKPLFMGWRKSYELPNALNFPVPAPCVRFALKGKEARLVTLLCPYNGTGKTPRLVEALSSISDTKAFIEFSDGSTAIIDELDYPCYADTADKLVGI